MLYIHPCSSQAQAAVKESKLRFDKLKVDLTEKIGMVTASRCNLLSRSLPTYQKAMLAFSDSAAAEFHRVLVDLRSHHHHQYKLHSDMAEIRDLEANEMTESQLLSTLEGGDSTPPLRLLGANDDVDLLDVSRPPGEGHKQPAEVGKEAKPNEGVLIPISPPPGELTELAKHQAAIANDLPLKGVEADLRALQKELLQEFGSSSPPRDPSLLSEGASGERVKGEGSDELRSADMDLNDLLGLGLGLEGEGGAEGPDFGPLVSSEGTGGEEEGVKGSSDVLTDQWNNFSSFMSTTRTPTKTSLSDWEKEFSASQPAPEAAAAETERDPFEDLDPLAATRRENSGGDAAAMADSFFSLHLPTAATPSLVPAPLSLLPAPLAFTSQPHPPITSGAVGGASSSKPHPPTKPSAGVKEPEKKGGSWMNVFAHLDPLSNEKA